MRTPRSTSASRRAFSNPAPYLALGLAAALVACGPRSGNTEVGDFDPSGLGKLGDGPNGFFINDANKGGLATNFLISGIFWGRLVDVFDEDEFGVRTRVFEDFLISRQLANTTDTNNDGVLDGTDYDLDSTLDFFLDQDPLTGTALLVVKHPLVVTGVAPNRVVDEVASADFLAAIQYLNDTANLDRVSDKGISVFELPPFSAVARNAALVIQFNDLVDESTVGPDTIKVFTGAPPEKPFEARILPDHSHGARAGTAFNTTRVLIDFTVSPAESGSTTAPVNELGLPPAITTNVANLGIRIPRIPVQSIGQFFVLRNSKGKQLSLAGNGPENLASPTLDVERAMRSGGATEVTGDPFNGFLPDNTRPSLLTRLPVNVLASPAPFEVAPGDLPAELTGVPDVWQVSWSYQSFDCALTPAPGHRIVFSALGGSAVGTVLLDNPDPVGGLASDILVQLEPNETAAVPSAGTASYVVAYDGSPALASFLRCFLKVTPTPGSPPAALLNPASNFVLEFSEAMDPKSLAAFDSFFVTNRRAGDGSFLPATRPWHRVPGTILPSQDLKSFTFSPVLPLSHVNGTAETYFINLVGTGTGLRDLAGNNIGLFLAPIRVALNANAATDRTGGHVLNFSSIDEDGNSGTVDPAPPGVPNFERIRPEVRGNIVHDTVNGTISPRPVTHLSFPIERGSNPDNLQVLMGTYPSAPPVGAPPTGTVYDNGISEPFSPFGSRVMTVWRYADMQFKVNDETTYDIDLEGMSWAPPLASSAVDVLPHFQISVAHSAFQPDEGLDTMGFLQYPNSGLLTTGWATNVLVDPKNKLKVVHPGFRGYIVDPTQAFLTDEENLMQPFPLNRGIPANQKLYYTWRNTEILAVGTDGSLGLSQGPLDGMMNPTPSQPSGIDLLAFANTGTGNIVTQYADISPTGKPQGAIAMSPNVPSIGLPLLLDFQVNPSDALGANIMDHGDPFGIGVPVFRIHSTGGFDPGGVEQIKIPSLQSIPTGGFNTNPLAGQVGAPTPGADSIMYFGQADFVVRVSRAHTVWIMVHGSIAEELDGTATGDAEANATFEPALVELFGQLPPGSSLVLNYRGGTLTESAMPAFAEGFGTEFIRRNALLLDAYGDEPATQTHTLNTDGSQMDNPLFLSPPSGKNANVAFDGGPTWKEFIENVDGSQYFQVRMTFVSEVATGSTPVLSGLGFAWDLFD